MDGDGEGRVMTWKAQVKNIIEKKHARRLLVEIQLDFDKAVKENEFIFKREVNVDIPWGSNITGTR